MLGLYDFFFLFSEYFNATQAIPYVSLIRGGKTTLISDGLHNVEFKQVGCARFKYRGGHNNMNTCTIR